MSTDATAEVLSLLLFVTFPLACGGFLWLFARVVRRGSLQTPWRRLALGNALVLALLVSLVFLGLESYYRYFYDTTDSFNYTKTSQRWFNRHYQRNNLGCRDDIDYQWRIAPSRRRLSFLGDSFTVGHGVKDVNRRFTNLIRAAVPQSEVHVLAANGFDTGQTLSSAQEGIKKGYQFDAVVLVYCLNDISDIVPEWQRTLVQIHENSKAPSWWVSNSYFVNILSHRWKARRIPAIRDYFQGIHGAYQGPVWEEQKQRLAALHEVIHAAGGHLAVVTFPFLHDIGPDYPWRDVHAQLAEFWRERHVPHLDLLPVLETHTPSELTVNRLDAHPNEFAHQLVAEAIIKFLASEPSSKP